MRAVQLVRTGRPLEARDLSVPPPGPDEVLVKIHAAGICHSDAHYRRGTSPAGPLPLTLGHEVSGVVDAIGDGVDGVRVGDRVCLHYIVSCGTCRFCAQGHEQFCPSGQMIGKDRDGGYAEYVTLPARSAVPLPESVPFAQGAIMMCSSATSLHALRKSRLRPGESVAVFGIGGLGLSALQLARLCGAQTVIAVDINPKKLSLAEELGACGVDATKSDPVSQIKTLTDGRGVDVALELIGTPAVMHQSVRSLAPMGRAVIVGLTDETITVSPYHDLINNEAEVIGASDHTAAEIRELITYYEAGKLRLSDGLLRRVPLDADEINATLDGLERFGDDVRVVIEP